MERELNWYDGKVSEVITHLGEYLGTRPLSSGLDSIILRCVNDSCVSDYIVTAFRIGRNGFQGEASKDYLQFSASLKAELLGVSKGTYSSLARVPIIAVPNCETLAAAVYYPESGWWLMLSTRLIDFYCLWSLLQTQIFKAWTNPANDAAVREMLIGLAELSVVAMQGGQLSLRAERAVIIASSFPFSGVGALARIYIRFVLLHEYAHVWHNDQSLDLAPGISLNDSASIARLLGHESILKEPPRHIPSENHAHAEKRADKWAREALVAKVMSDSGSYRFSELAARMHSTFMASFAIAPQEIHEEIYPTHENSHPTGRQRIEALFEEVEANALVEANVRSRNSLVREAVKEYRLSQSIG